MTGNIYGHLAKHKPKRFAPCIPQEKALTHKCASAFGGDKPYALQRLALFALLCLTRTFLLGLRSYTNQ